MQSILSQLPYSSLQPTQLALAIEILKTYNCRAHEVLSAQWPDFFPDKFLILKGCKKSSNIIIRDRFILSLVASLPRLHSTLIFPSINYYHLYRHCKKYYSHLGVKFKKRKNYKVTHMFRYENVSQIGNDEKIRDILHHRSTKSGKFYKL
jgi:hypothetical protein